jgi:hypothetical protein
MSTHSQNLKEKIIAALDANDSATVSFLLSQQAVDPLTSEDYKEVLEHITVTIRKNFLEPKPYMPDPKFNKLQVVDLGTFEVKSGRLLVTDPCYKIGTWCQGTLESVRNGTWHACVERQNLNDWGIRNWKIRITHSDFLNKKPDVATDIDVGVDSGQAGFFDRAEYPKGNPDTNPLFQAFYDKICKITWGDFDQSDDDFPNAGILPFGVVSSSGVGDGGYKCYTSRVNNEIVAAEIRFLGEDDGEDAE